jgi:hypothetical protein
MMIDDMEIVINVVTSTTGRLAGTLRAPGSKSTTEFDGTMELFSALERICTADDRSVSP